MAVVNPNIHRGVAEMMAKVIPNGGDHSTDAVFYPYTDNFGRVQFPKEYPARFVDAQIEDPQRSENFGAW